MANQNRGKLEQFKDTLQSNRNKIVYVLALTGLFLCLAEWAMLPEQVGMVYSNGELTNFAAKKLVVSAHLAIILGFDGMFWKWPREIVYLIGSALGILVALGVLVTNLGLV